MGHCQKATGVSADHRNLKLDMISLKAAVILDFRMTQEFRTGQLISMDLYLIITLR